MQPSILAKSPDLIDVLRRCIEYQAVHEHEWRDKLLGFDRYQVGATGQHMSKLMGAGFVISTYHTSCQTFYRVADMSKVRDILAGMDQREADAVPMNLENVDERIFDFIVGYDDIKRIIILALKAEKPVHFLLCGPRASGKSLFMYALERIGAYYIAGDGLSGPGLIDLLYGRPEISILAVDELDKGKREALYPLLSIMEEGIISETKYGRTRTEKRPIKVFAAANRVNKFLSEQLSRFQVLHFREYTEDEYRTVVEKVLITIEGKPPEVAEVIAELAARELNSIDVREAVRIARLSQTIDDVNFVVKTFKIHKEENVKLYKLQEEPEEVHYLKRRREEIQKELAKLGKKNGKASKNNRWTSFFELICDNFTAIEMENLLDQNMGSEVECNDGWLYYFTAVSQYLKDVARCPITVPHHRREITAGWLETFAVTLHTFYKTREDRRALIEKVSGTDLNQDGFQVEKYLVKELEDIDRELERFLSE